MRLRNLLLLVLAVLLFGGTMMLARSWLASQRAREVQVAPPAPKPARSVLIARGGLTRGQILKPEDLTWQAWPDGAIDPNYLLSGGPQTPQSFTGSVAVYPIAAGEPITKAKLIAPGDRGYLAAVLRPGTRAIAVPVNPTTTEAGLVYPGDSVDVLLTYSVNRPGGNGTHQVAETVLHDVRVIGIDENLGGKPGEHTFFPNPRNATLEVAPKQSEVIALANRMGSLTLVLRSLVPGPADMTTAEQRGDEIIGATLASVTTPGVGAPATAHPAAASVVTLIANRGADPPAGGAIKVVDSSGAAAPAGGPRVATPAQPGNDTTTAKAATYTVDNEISSLIPPLGGHDNDQQDVTKYWVARGPDKLDWNHPEAAFLVNHDLGTGSVSTSAEGR
jgi:pilus assembly protein CpaB